MHALELPHGPAQSRASCAAICSHLREPSGSLCSTRVGHRARPARESPQRNHLEMSCITSMVRPSVLRAILGSQSSRRARRRQRSGERLVDRGRGPTRFAAEIDWPSPPVASAAPRQRARQRDDRMAGASQGSEDSGANVTGGAGEKDAHAPKMRRQRSGRCQLLACRRAGGMPKNWRNAALMWLCD